jgi:gamma-glutamyltranspeptidase / glutathione hydrolase / leukotriene-C4 hydrolase
VSTKLFNGDTLHTAPLPSSGTILTFIMNILEGYRFNEQPYTWHRNDKLIYHRIVEAFKFGFGMRTRLGDETTPEIEAAIEELLDVIFADKIREKIDDERTFNDTAHYGANGPIALDYGTAHVSILAPNGDSVSLTSTINTV